MIAVSMVAQRIARIGRMIAARCAMTAGGIIAGS
jgi:hypothetical protein